MQKFCAVFGLFAIFLCVFVRNFQLNRVGIRAFYFGKIDKSDFLIPPFMLFYFYLVLAGAFGLPGSAAAFANDSWAAWTGAVLCLLAPVVFLWGIVSFGRSFRVGIDLETPGELVDSGAFAVSRNPLYLSLFMIFLGNFLVFQGWVFLLYFLCALWLVDRQVCREENSLRRIYGAKYDEYCERVRRYL